jgi:hypothetical protein
MSSGSDSDTIILSDLSGSVCASDQTQKNLSTAKILPIKLHKDREFLDLSQFDYEKETLVKYCNIHLDKT